MGFLFRPETDKWLCVLRIGLGLQVAVYALFLRSDWHYLFASTGRGLVSRKLGEAITSFDSPLIPKLGWLVALGGYAHIGEDAVLSIAWACLLCMGLFLLLGLFSRPAAIIAWFLHLCAAESGGLFAYGVDNFMTTGLFYLMLSPLPDRYSLDHWLLKVATKRSTSFGFLAPRFAGAYVLHLLYRRLGEMSGQRLVGWFQSLAIADPSTFQPYFPRHSCSIQIRATDPWNFDLSNRTWLPNFHLDKEDPLVLVGVHPGNARGDWTGNGNVSFRPCDDRFESRRLRYRNEQGPTFLCRGYRGPKRSEGQRTGISERAAFGASPLNSADAKAHSANRPAAETLFKFSQNFGLGNLFQFVVQGWLQHANVENAFAQCYRRRVRSDKFTDDSSPRVHYFRLMQTLA